MLTVKNLSYDINQQYIIEEINFTVSPGEVLCLLGPNGAGKTTIIKCINQIYQPSQGWINVDGQNIFEFNRKEIASRIAYIPQEQNTAFSYSVLEFTVMGFAPHLNWWDKPAAQEYQHALEQLKELGISHLHDRQFNNLSGGEKQLVLLARTLIQDSDYLLMDEPISHLDFKNQHLLLNKLLDLAHNKSKGIIITLHDPNLARRFSHKSVIISEGKVIKKGNSKEIVNHKNLEEAYRVLIEPKPGEAFYPMV